MAMTMGLTGKLRLELEKTNNIFGKWTASQNEWLQSSESSYYASMDECKHTLAALQENETKLELLREQNEKVRSEQALEVRRLAEEVEALRLKDANLQPLLTKLSGEEADEVRALEGVERELLELKERTERSLHDLTHGLSMYAALGLQFQKADGDCMRFIFTQLDRRAPLREFYFVMFVDAQEKYQLVTASPAIDAQHSARLLQQLNTDNDIGKFVLHVRNAFRRLCV